MLYVHTVPCIRFLRRRKIGIRRVHMLTVQTNYYDRSLEARGRGRAGGGHRRWLFGCRRRAVAWGFELGNGRLGLDGWDGTEKFHQCQLWSGTAQAFPVWELRWSRLVWKRINWRPLVVLYFRLGAGCSFSFQSNCQLTKGQSMSKVYVVDYASLTLPNCSWLYSLGMFILHIKAPPIILVMTS